MMAQAIALGKGVHVIVGTPGRVVDHLSNTKARAACTPALDTRLLICPCKFRQYQVAASALSVWATAAESVAFAQGSWKHMVDLAVLRRRRASV